MAKIEVDETQFMNAIGVVKTVDSLLKNPKSRRMLLEAQKAADPNVSIPELDAPKPYEEQLGKIGESVAALNKRMDDDAAERKKQETLGALNTRFQAGRSALKAAGYTAEGIEQIEKIMEEKGIAEHDVAAAYFDRLHPPASTVQPSGFGRWDFMEAPAEAEAEGKALKDLMESRGDNEGAVNSLVRSALDAVRGAKAA